MIDTRFNLAEAVALLERTPATLRALLHNLPDPWTAADEGRDTFTAFDNVGHLIHGERTDWMERIGIVLAQGPNRTFTPYDRFAQVHESAGKSMGQLLDEFAALRATNLDGLRAMNLGERELALVGEHPALGPVTLRQLLASWVVHDLGHIAQITRVMAKRYRDEIGPWRAYLPIVDRGGPKA